MKYNIQYQLPVTTVDLANRFHAAMLARLHELQGGASLIPGAPVDEAISAMEEWGLGSTSGVMAPHTPEATSQRAMYESPLPPAAGVKEVGRG